MGMRMRYVAVPPKALARAQGDHGRLDELTSDDANESHEIEKLWDALHFLHVPERRKKSWRGISGDALPEGDLHTQAIFGARALSEDTGQLVGVSDAETVIALADALGKVSTDSLF